MYIAYSSPLILDKVKGSAAFYGLRKMQARYKKYAIRVRRSSDNTEKDIGFASGKLDVSDLLSFVNGGSGYITKWYDQSGNGNDAVQTTALNQPRIVNSGVVEKDSNGNPTVFFNGSNSILSIPNSTSVDITNSPLLMNAVFTLASNINGFILCKNLDTGATTQYGVAYITTNKSNYIYLEGNSVQFGGVNSISLNTQTIYSGELSGSTVQGYINGAVSGGAGSYIGSLTSRANFQIGARSGNAAGTIWNTYFNGYISELIICSDVSSRTKIEQSQGSFYGINIST